jgi:hypothetical protein
MDHFCFNFGINRDWLIEGKETPYSNHDALQFDPCDYLAEILNSNPERIFFILCRSEVGEAFLILKFFDWRYKILRKIWHISNHVGGSGQGQIIGMYRLINSLRDKGLSHKCMGQIVKNPVPRAQGVKGQTTSTASHLFLFLDCGYTAL